MIVEDLKLPEFAFLDGHCSDEDMLAHRNVAIHIPSGLIIEFVDGEEPISTSNPNLVCQLFTYRNSAGYTETMSAFVHHCNALDSCEVWFEATQSILPAAIKWYCDYLTWEDSQIAEEDRISLS